MNASRMLVLIAASLMATPLAWSATPDFSGTWEVIDPPKALHTTSGDLPPLLPDARATYDANVKARAAGDLTFDTTERCVAPGVPRLMYVPEPFEIIQRDQYIYMLFQYQHLNREILFRDQHGALPYGRRFLGETIARWDGDTLVLDTTGIKPGTLLDQAGLPHSKQLHVVERYHLDSSGQLIGDIQIEDPKTYSQPWNTTVRFKRLHDVQIKEDVCVDRHPDWFKQLMKSEP